MRTLERMLLAVSLPVWTFVAWLLLCETAVFPETFRGSGILFQWQLWAVAGIVLRVTRERVCDHLAHRDYPVRKTMRPTGGSVAFTVKAYSPIPGIVARRKSNRKADPDTAVPWFLAA